MATFLKLCQDTRQEAGLSGSGPSSVVNQVGMDKKVVDWVNDAWFDIQSARTNWRWMWRDDGLVTTISGTKSYDLSLLGFDIESILPESVSIMRAGIPSSITRLEVVEYDQFREQTKFIAEQSGQPVLASIDPSGKLVVYPTPNDAYEIRFEYYIPPQALSENTDVPEMPEKFHRMIIALAMMKYAGHDDATGVYQVAQMEYTKWMRRLEQSQLLDVSTGETLV